MAIFDEVCEHPLCKRAAEYRAVDFVRIVKNGKTVGFRDSSQTGAIKFYCSLHKTPPNEVLK